jgi:hypothetical protein
MGVSGRIITHANASYLLGCWSQDSWLTANKSDFVNIMVCSNWDRILWCGLSASQHEQADEMMNNASSLKQAEVFRLRYCSIDVYRCQPTVNVLSVLWSATASLQCL